MRHRFGFGCLLAVSIFAFGEPQSASAQTDFFYMPRRRVYSALDAGLDAYQFHDSIRREQIAHQMDLSNQMLLKSYPGFYDPWGPDPFDAPAIATPAAVPGGWWDPDYYASPPSYFPRNELRSVRIGANRIYYRAGARTNAIVGDNDHSPNVHAGDNAGARAVEELPPPRSEPPSPRDAQPGDAKFQGNGPRAF